MDYFWRIYSGMKYVLLRCVASGGIFNGSSEETVA